VAVIAYSPFGHNDFPAPRSPGGKVLQDIADARQVSPRQVALAFLTRRPAVLAIPKAASANHAADNAAAGSLHLSEADYAGLDDAFPTGREPSSLPML
jgi:diketogulonate reductase-like aldo/keto reductase